MHAFMPAVLCGVGSVVRCCCLAEQQNCVLCFCGVTKPGVIWNNLVHCTSFWLLTTAAQSTSSAALTYLLQSQACQQLQSPPCQQH